MLFRLEEVDYREILHISELAIPEQKISCVFGESGSGKTTFLKLLNNLITPDKGKVFFYGRDVAEIDPIQLRARVVMLPQQPVIFSGNVADNLQIGLGFSHKPLASEARLKELLDFVQLAKGLNQPVDSLSGGEKQRLALARVLAMEPEVLLLDEPSSALDEETERLVLDRVTKFALQNDRSVIMVTHSREVVERYAQNRIHLTGGTVKEGHYDS